MQPFLSVFTELFQGFWYEKAAFIEIELIPGDSENDLAALCCGSDEQNECLPPILSPLLGNGGGILGDIFQLTNKFDDIGIRNFFE